MWSSSFVRLIILGLIIYIVTQLVKAWQKLGDKARRPRQARLGGRMVKDEVCDTYVPLEEALRVVRDGREHFFCSPECRDRFLAGGGPEAGATPPKT